MLTELKKSLIQQGPQGWSGALATVLSPLEGQDLYKMGKSFSDLVTSSVCKERETKGRKEKEERSVLLTSRQMWLFLFGSRVLTEKH